jgi:hypothetical protein
MAIIRIYLQTGDFVASAVAVVRSPVLSIVLAPASWATNIVLSQFTGSSGTGTQMLELGMLALVSFVLVVARVKYSYEASLEASMRIASRVAAIREGGFRALWSRRKKAARPSVFIMPFGRGAGAMLWKNILITARNLGKLSFLVFLIPVLAILIRPYVRTRIGEEAAGTIGIMLLVNLVWITAMLMLQDLRASLKQVDVLKPMPLPAWKLIAAETIPGAGVVTAAIWLLVISAGIVFGLPRYDYVLLVLLALPVVAYDAICSQVPIAILYPNWTDPTQAWIGGLFSGLSTMIAIGPPAVVGGILLALKVSALIVTPAVIIIAAAFAMAGILLGSYVWTRRDPVFD